MKYICGMTFGFCARRGDFKKEATRESLQLMKQRTNADTVMLTVTAWQDTPQSTKIGFNDDDCVSREEVVDLIRYAQSLGLRVILKPMVNCRNGTWRAFIDFFDVDVVCEPKWSEWFASYTEYMLIYATIAQETGCEMLVIGCEFVKADRREAEWRELIKKIRPVYRGLLTYNCDKYQEGNVRWWDALDVISSSGYYPPQNFENELTRIAKVVEQFKKPFFFSEIGIMSVTGASVAPNNWNVQAEINYEEQSNFWRTVFAACEKNKFVNGFAIWDWPHLLGSDENFKKNYCVFDKPAEKIIKEFYSKKQKL